LQVVRHRQVCDAAAAVGGADGDVHHGGQLCRVVDHLVVLGDVGVEPVECYLLLVAGAQNGGLLHAGDREHGHVIQLRVIQAVQQVDTTRPRGGEAHTDP